MDKFIKPLAVIPLLFFLLFTKITYSQSLDSKGTDFWLAFPENAASNVATLSFFLSSETNSEVTINIPSLSLTDTVSLVPNVAIKYDLPSALEVTVFDIAGANGISVRASEEISIYGLSRVIQSTDAYQAIPLDVLGTEYQVLAWDQGVLGSSEFLMLATEDNTNIKVTPSLLDTSRIEPFDITLNQGETYQIKTVAGDDTTGTKIESSSPIAVFAGHQCANIPNTGTRFCDHIVEQLNPVNSWGSQFYTAPLFGRLGGDTYRVLAAEDATNISVNNTVVSTIDAGEYFETLLGGGNFISTDKPVLLAQYSNSTTFDNTPNSDPFMMLISPFEQYLDNYTFATPTEGFPVNYVNIVTRTDSIEKLLLDGSALSPGDFTNIAGSAYSFAQISLTAGSHNLTGALAGIYVYGFADDDSYGYPGGLSLSSVGSVDNVELLPEYQLVDDQACFKVKVSDLNKLPLRDIRVDFLVDLISGFDTTDTDGIATFCVEAGPNPGEFDVTASVGAESATATVTQEVVNNPDSGSGGGGGGGGCSLGTPSDTVDPTLPILAVLSLLFILHRRRRESRLS